MKDILTYREGLTIHKGFNHKRNLHMQKEINHTQENLPSKINLTIQKKF